MARSLRTAEQVKLQTLLVETRKRAGLTQTELAEKMKRPQSFVAKYEGGERRLDVIEFCEIAAALGMDAPTLLAQLLGDTDWVWRPLMSAARS
jgi:transcriptional regulator with XRE-family HTH domain